MHVLRICILSAESLSYHAHFRDPSTSAAYYHTTIISHCCTAVLLLCVVCLSVVCGVHDTKQKHHCRPLQERRALPSRHRRHLRSATQQSLRRGTRYTRNNRKNSGTIQDQQCCWSTRQTTMTASPWTRPAFLTASRSSLRCWKPH